jgi:TolA-binding protein
MLLAGLGATWGGIAMSFAVGKWARSREMDGPKLAEQMKSITDALLYRIQQLEKSQDNASGRMSDLTGKIQILIERFDARINGLKTEFVTRTEWDLTERRRKDVV